MIFSFLSVADDWLGGSCHVKLLVKNRRELTFWRKFHLAKIENACLRWLCMGKRTALAAACGRIRRRAVLQTQ